MKNLKEILLVITRPIKAFSKIKKKLLIAPFIFLIVGAALMQTSQEIVKRQKSLKSLKAELKKVQSGESQLELPENVPRLDQEKMIKEEIKAQKNFLQATIYIIGTSILLAIVLLMQVLLFFIIINMIGGKAVFKTVFSVITLAWIPIALRYYLKFIYIMVAKTVPAAGLVSLLPLKEGPAPPSQLMWMVIFSKIDFFTLWNLVLLSLALIYSFNISRMKSVITVTSFFISLILIWSLLSMALGGLSFYLIGI